LKGILFLSEKVVMKCIQLNLKIVKVNYKGIISPSPPFEKGGRGDLAFGGFN
jgi:hypothetical protein